MASDPASCDPTCAAAVSCRDGSPVPHAVLHESSVTFLGFGLPSNQPAVGNILAESMRYLLGGQWWLAVFPGVFLTIVTGLFYAVGQNLRKLTDPGSVHD